MRLIWLLMLATRDLPQVFRVVGSTDKVTSEPRAHANPRRSTDLRDVVVWGPRHAAALDNYAKISRSQRSATSPCAAWNARTVGSPGGGGSRALTAKYPAIVATRTR